MFVLIVSWVLLYGYGLAGLDVFRLSIGFITIGLLLMILQHGIDSTETLEHVLLSDRSEREKNRAELAVRAAMLESRTEELSLLLSREQNTKELRDAEARLVADAVLEHLRAQK